MRQSSGAATPGWKRKYDAGQENDAIRYASGVMARTQEKEREQQRSADDGKSYPRGQQEDQPVEAGNQATSTKQRLAGADFRQGERKMLWSESQKLGRSTACALISPPLACQFPPRTQPGI